MTAPQTATGNPHEVLRSAVAGFEGELARTEDVPPALREAWVSLVNALALGPKPELRDCPACGKPCMRAATRCGYCWIALVSEAALPGARP